MDIELALLRKEIFTGNAEDEIVVDTILKSLPSLKKDKRYTRQEVTNNSFQEKDDLVNLSLLSQLLENYAVFPGISKEWRTQSSTFDQEALWDALRAGLKNANWNIAYFGKPAEEELYNWFDVNKSVWADIEERKAFVFEKSMEMGLLNIMELCAQSGLDFNGDVKLGEKEWGAKSLLGRADAKSIPMLLESGVSPFVGTPRPWDEWFGARSVDSGVLKVCSELVYKDLLKDSNSQVKDVWSVLKAKTRVPEITDFLKKASKVGLWNLADKNGKTTVMLLAERGMLYKGLLSSIPAEEWVKKDKNDCTPAFYETRQGRETNTFIDLTLPPYNKIMKPLTVKEWAYFAKETMQSDWGKYDADNIRWDRPNNVLIKMPTSLDNVSLDTKQVGEFLSELIQNEDDLERFAIAVMCSPLAQHSRSKYTVSTAEDLGLWHDALRNSFPKNHPLLGSPKLNDLGILMLWKAHSNDYFESRTEAETNKFMQDWLNRGGSFERAFQWTAEIIQKEQKKAADLIEQLPKTKHTDWKEENSIKVTVEGIESRWSQDVMNDQYLASEQKMKKMFQEFKVIEETHRLKERAFSGLETSSKPSISAL